MNPFSLISLAAAVVIGSLGAILFAQRPRDQVVRVFLIFALLGAYLCFVEFQLQSGITDRTGAELWARARSLWPLAPALLLHFVLLQSGAWPAGQRRWIYPLLYLPALLLVASHLGDMSPQLSLTRWGWVTGGPALDRRALITIAWVLGICGLVAGLGLRHWHRSAAGLRRQARYLALGALAPVLLAILADVVLPRFWGEAPRLATAGSLAAALVIALGARKLDLFAVSPAAAAEIIIANMSDLLFLTDQEGKILRTNQAALRMLSLRESEVVGRSVDEILPELKAARARATSVKDMEAPVLTRDRRTLLLSLSCSSIRDHAGRVVGMTFIGRDITDRRRVEDARRSLVRSMIKAQDEERRRIARELHDETGQVLGSLIAELRVLEDQVGSQELQARVSGLRQLVTTALQEVRRISHGMHPAVLDALGLAAALRHYAAEFSRLHQVTITAEIVGIEERRSLPPEVETTLYRVVQEALTNVARHAEARLVSLYVVRQGSLLRAIIEDDGRGFDAEDASRGLGLPGIKERVSLLGGTVRLETAPGEGVTLKVELPLQGKT